jgi:hypothetical protein
MLENVRIPLLEEAKQSPSLLSDLAGLEEYVAESYDSRSFIELLQNADDAGASRFLIEKSGPFLLVANDGRQFTQKDFESLCRSAASSKSRGSSIGYRGIGFKSVVGLAKTIHLISGELEATFSRERTAQEIPQATRVPLIRIPHPIESTERNAFALSLEKLRNDGFVSVFIFNDLMAAAIDNEFSSFDPSSLLFLRNIRHLELRTKTEMLVTVRREAIDGRMRSIRLTSGDGVAQWIVAEKDNVALAFHQKLDLIEKLDERDAVVHAFLPTTEPTGLAIKIHGDISTDPSRTRVVFDERTETEIQTMAALVLSIIDDAISGRSLPDDSGMLSALMPLTDPRMNKFQKKSFKSEFITALQKLAGNRFEHFRCRPAWINPIDFETLARACSIQIIPRHFESIGDINSFLRFLNIKEATLDEFSGGLCNTELSILGVSEVVADLVTRFNTKQIEIQDINPDWRLWPVEGQNLSLSQAKAHNLKLDDNFKDLVSEKTVGESGVRRLITSLSDPEMAAILLPKKSSSPVAPEIEKPATPQSDSPTAAIKPLSLKRWRGAEEQVLNILASQGWTAQDVSRQNLGYDIECKTQDGENVFVEVKLVKSSTQPFALTSNEEAVARQKGANYQIAIVQQIGDVLEVAFIRDPITQMTLTRQCRQWVWECSDYPYIAQRFPLES